MKKQKRSLHTQTITALPAQAMLPLTGGGPGGNSLPTGASYSDSGSGSYAGVG